MTLAETYAHEAAVNNAVSLARVATLVVNRGSFFSGMARGRGCSLRNFERFVAWFEDPTNWPDAIPLPASNALKLIGRKCETGGAIDRRCEGLP